MLSINPEVIAQQSNESHVVLVDIRSPSARLKGMPLNAKSWSKEQLSDQAKLLKQQGKKVYILCYKGLTSAQVAAELMQLWGEGFYSVEGGFEAWQHLGLPVETPVSSLSIDPSMDRYERQIKSAGFGQANQQKLLNSHVLVVGAGGLGTPALLYLAGAGIGKITLVDDDIIALHNLHRQVLYQQADVGDYKSKVAEQRLKALNSDIDIKALNQRVTAENADQLFAGVDLVIDGSDNINTRYVINDACLALGKPWVFAAVVDFTIQLALFTGDKLFPCYRCLFPGLIDSEMDNCEAAGILGFVPGLAGMLQVTEAIKYITGMGDCLEQQMLNYDLLQHQFKVLKYPSEINNNCQH